MSKIDKIEDKSITRKEFIEKVSIHTDFRGDIVEMILDGITDVIIEEIVNNGKFSLKQLFFVTSAEWRAYKITEGAEIPKTVRLRVALSETIRELWKIRHSVFGGDKDKITKDNWREVFASHRKIYPSRMKAGDKGAEEHHSVPSNNDLPETYNPFLDDDDEY